MESRHVKQHDMKIKRAQKISTNYRFVYFRYGWFEQQTSEESLAPVHSAEKTIGDKPSDHFVFPNKPSDPFEFPSKFTSPSVECNTEQALAVSIQFHVFNGNNDVICT